MSGPLSRRWARPRAGRPNPCTRPPTPPLPDTAAARNVSLLLPDRCFLHGNPFFFQHVDLSESLVIPGHRFTFFKKDQESLRRSL